MVSYSAACALRCGAEIFREMGQRAHHRIRREAAERAERTELHRIAEIFAARSRFSARRSPAMIRSMISTPRVEPIRHGVHLPQDSTAQNSIANRACRAMSTRIVEHHHAAMADQAVARGEGFVVERRVEQRAREIGAERPADLHRLAPAGR